MNRSQLLKTSLAEWHGVLCFALSLLMVYQLHAQSGYQAPHFAFDDISRAHLTYYVIENRFDSAYANLTVGEFSIQTGACTHRLLLRTDSLSSTVFAQGSPGQGRDYSLARWLRTESFDVPRDVSSISFFRMPRVKPTCSPTGTGSASQPQSGDGSPSVMDWHFKPGNGVLLDETRFYIELVREADDSVLAVLDSVGIRGKTDSRFADVFGTLPTTVYRTVPTPEDARGQRAFLRIVHYRTGPSPFGCTAHLYPYRMNLSAFQRYAEGEYSSWMQDDPRFDVLDSLYWSACLSYFDGLLATKGCVLPQEAPRYYPSEKHDSMFAARYYDSVGVSSVQHNVRVVYPKNCQPQEKQTASSSQNTTFTPFSVSLRSSNASSTTVRLDAGVTLDRVIIRIVSVPGGHVATATEVFCLSSLCDVDVPTSSLHQGRYQVVATTQDGRTASVPLVVVR